MCGILKIDITESEATLKTLVQQQSSARQKERLQALYWLKSGQVSTRLELSSLLGRGESTLYRWLQRYQAGGLGALLDIKPSSGRPAMIGGDALSALKARLSEPSGFESYGAIQQWLQAEWGLEVPYKTVHQTVHYRLKAKLKVPRPRSRQSDEAQQQAYKKNSLASLP
jgi:transposase